MAATKTKPTLTTRATESAKAKTEGDSRVIDHVSQTLGVAQDDLGSIGGSREPARVISARTSSGCSATLAAT